MGLHHSLRLLILISMLLCKGVLYGQSKPVYIGDSNELGPGLIQIEATINKIIDADTLCGRPYDSAIVVTVERILAKGRSVNRPVASSQELTLGLHQDLTIEVETQVGQRVNMLLREVICLDTQNTSFSILSLTQN